MTNLDSKKKLTVVGMGYIGLPTATLFATAGFKVFGYDVNEQVINTLKSGKIHIVEPDLQKAFENALNSGNLIPTNELIESDIFIICVPTPFKENQEEKLADLSYVEKASKTVGKVLKKGNLVVLESTVPPNTTEQIMGKILEKESNLKMNEDFYVAHCPERVLPGKILHELRNNDRIIGVSNKKAGELAKELYSSIVTGGNIYITDTVTAEMCKLVENTYRDINIAFANELSIICDELGIDVWELINLANKHPRVNILKPGPGVGGHCLAVDPWFIVEKFPKKARLIRTSREVNEYKPKWVVEKVIEDIENKFDNKKITIGILGLAYKPNIDDLRESPALEIAKELKNKGYNVVACEPNSTAKEIKGIRNLTLDGLIETSDYLIYAVAHNQFRIDNMVKLTKPIFNTIRAINMDS